MATPQQQQLAQVQAQQAQDQAQNAQLNAQAIAESHVRCVASVRHSFFHFLFWPPFLTRPRAPRMTTGAGHAAGLRAAGGAAEPPAGARAWSGARGGGIIDHCSNVC
jgi:hypothetical protein